MDQLTLAVYADVTRRERLDVELQPDITSVVVTNSVNKGYEQCRIGIREHRPYAGNVVYAGLPEPVEVRHFSHAELWFGGMLMFEGRVEPFTYPTTSLVVNGYHASLRDRWYTSSDTTEYTSGQVLQKIIAFAAPLVYPATTPFWLDPIIPARPIDFDGAYPIDALRKFESQGDIAGETVDWFIWEDRRLHLVRRALNGLPEYTIPFDPAYIEGWISDPNEIYAGVTVEFSQYVDGSAVVPSGSTSVTVTHNLGFAPEANKLQTEATNDQGAAIKHWVENITSTTFDIALDQDPGVATATFDWAIEVPGQRTDESVRVATIQQYGIDRRLLIKAGTLPLAVANAIRDRTLRYNSTPRVSAKLNLPFDVSLMGTNGTPYPPYLARAGQWVRVGDENDQYIYSVSIDFNSRMVAISLGDRRPTYADLIKRLEELEALRRRGYTVVGGKL